MATTVAILQAKLQADTRDFDTAMGKSESKMKGLAKTAGKAGVAGAVIGLGYAVKAGIGEFMEAQKVTAQTNAVIKSTGGVANVSTGHIQKLSESLMKKSGVDDEAIQSGQNMLLTFTKVHNEAGKGNDIFDQATKATLNLSVAMGKDMQQSSIMVGKALNDPIKGMTALAKAGIQFDSDQKTAIKTMVATGDTAGAQKMILKELETQFGGSAEAAGKTFSGQINIARETMLNFAGSAVEKAIPVLTSLATFVRETLIPAFRRYVEFLRDTFGPIISAVKDVVVNTWKAIAGVLKEHEPEIKRITDGVTAYFKTMGTIVKWLATEIIIPILKPVFEKVLPVAIGILITALDLLFTGIGKVIDGMLWLKDHAGDAFNAFKNKADGPLGAVKTAFEKIVGFIDRIVDGVKKMIDWIGKIPEPPSWMIPGKGDPFDPNMVFPPASSVGNLVGARGLDGASAVMLPFANQAAAFGLSVSSGLRPGARTRSGNLSDHAIGRALDLVGPSSGMAAFFRSLIGNRGVKQAFYDPLGSIFGGALNSYREGGHSDHVHVATYDQGGYLKPGWNLAYNGLGRPEPVGAGNVTFNFPNYVGSRQELMSMLQAAAVRFEQRNGRPAFGT